MEMMDGAVLNQISVGDPMLDPFRSVVVDALKDPRKDSLKKTEIRKLAKESGITVSEVNFLKVMKSLCISKPGGFWQVKTSM